MKFYLDRDVVSAECSQTFFVEAENIEEAKRKFLEGDSDIECSDVDVTQLSEIDTSLIYKD